MSLVILSRNYKGGDFG